MTSLVGSSGTPTVYSFHAVIIYKVIVPPLRHIRLYFLSLNHHCTKYCTAYLSLSAYALIAAPQALKPVLSILYTSPPSRRTVSLTPPPAPPFQSLITIPSYLIPTYKNGFLFAHYPYFYLFLRINTFIFPPYTHFNPQTHNNPNYFCFHIATILVSSIEPVHYNCSFVTYI